MIGIYNFAVADQSGGLIAALGLDVRLLVLQALAFLILVFILGKFVYPVILKAIDERRDKIEAGLASAKKSEAELKNVEKKVAEIIRDARVEANQIIDRSQRDAAAQSEASEAKALKKAQAIIDEARAQMTNDLQAAREALKKETAELVAKATEHIIKEKIDATKDAKLLADALQEAK